MYHPRTVGHDPDDIDPSDMSCMSIDNILIKYASKCDDHSDSESKSETGSSKKIYLEHFLEPFGRDSHTALKDEDDQSEPFDDTISEVNKSSSGSPSVTEIIPSLFHPKNGTVQNRKAHFARFGLYAEALWSKNLITDITIKIHEYTFSAHKSVLACFSSYFKRKLGEKNSDKMQLVGVPPDIFKILLNYMYTGELKLTCQTLPDVFFASKKLEVNDAIRKCIEKLRGKHKGVESYLYLYVAAKKLGLPERWKHSYKLILNHFEESVCCKEFLELEVDQVCEILSGEEIASRSEVVVYLAALKWINHNYLMRERYAVRVMSCVRFPMMTSREILLCFHPPLAGTITKIAEVRFMLLSSLCRVMAEKFGFEDHFSEYACPSRRYLVSGPPLNLWDLGSSSSSNIGDRGSDSSVTVTGTDKCEGQGSSAFPGINSRTSLSSHLSIR